MSQTITNELPYLKTSWTPGDALRQALSFVNYLVELQVSDEERSSFMRFEDGSRTLDGTTPYRDTHWLQIKRLIEVDPSVVFEMERL